MVGLEFAVAPQLSKRPSMLVRHLPSPCFLLAFAVCACHRPAEPPAGKSTVSASGSAASAPTPSETPVPPKSLHDRIDEFQNRVPPHPPSDNAKSIVVWHILIAYQGAAGAPASVTRTKENAKELAGTVRAEMSAGADFEALALKYSDDPKVKTDHGKLGKIGRTQLDKAFTEYAFALMKFETGPIPLDTPAGLEIIRRME